MSVESGWLLDEDSGKGGGDVHQLISEVRMWEQGITLKEEKKERMKTMQKNREGGEEKEKRKWKRKMIKKNKCGRKRKINKQRKRRN